MAGLKAGLKQELKSSWKNTFLRRCRPQRRLEEHPTAGAGGQYDPFGPLLYSLRSELAGFKDFLQGQTDLFLSCRGKKEDFSSL